MAKIKTVVFPANEKGNDANDHRDDADIWRKAEIMPTAITASVTKVEPDNEDDLGLIFSDKYQNDLRYVALMGKWLLWDGNVWKQDQILEVFDLIRKLCRKYFSDKESLRKRFLNSGTVSAIERLVRSDIAHRATVDQWDSDDWILNTPTGIVDLNTGNLQPHEPNQHCTKITAAGPDGDCPIFQKFLRQL